MKKLISLIMVLALVLAIGSACTVSQATRMRDMVGTYKLTYYNNRTTNLVERDEMEVYLVVPESGYGYYVYKDKNTPVYIREITVSLTPHQKKANRYTHVVYRFDDSGDAVEFGRSGDGLNKKVLAVQNGDTYLQDTIYKRVDKAQDLSYVQSQFSEALPEPITFGYGRYDGYYTFSYVDTYSLDSAITDTRNTPFVYAIFDVDVAANKAIINYMLKTDMERRAEEYTLSVNKDAATISVGSKTFSLQLSGYTAVDMRVPVSLTASDSSTVDCNYVFTRYARNSFDLENNIQAEIDWYNSWAE